MVDKYEPISLIGKGNFGSISKIRRKSDGKILVWKELNYGSMKEKYKHHISSEINILKELHHPNIVKYYDRIIDKENTKIYIVMEYCPGGDLSQLIKRCRQSKQYINEDIIWKIFSQVVSALYACHTNKLGKILHRDIKPSNVFLDNENNVKLGDFGLSLQLNKEMNFAYSNVGTPYYMSPEQVDENKYNEKSDIWSLGCFLYELTALHPPFEAHNHLSLALKIKSGKIEKLPEKYSQSLSKVIFWLMNVDPNKRPSIRDIILLPEVSFKIKEKKVKDYYQRLKKFENELKIKEAKLLETEQKLKLKEKYLDEREKNIIQRENNLNLKEGDNKFNNEEITEKKNNNDLFITSGGFDIKGLNDEDNDINDMNDLNDLNDMSDNEENFNNDILVDEELNSIKNIPLPNDKNYHNKKNINSMNESIPKMVEKKYSNTIRRSLMNDKMKSDYENNKIQNSRDNSLFSQQLKPNAEPNINSNSFKNLLSNNYSSNKNNNINTINFNNSNNSLSKINSNKNALADHSKVISFNSELNYSSNDEKVVKNNNNNNNINSSNINSLGYLSINSQENPTMIYNNSNNNNNMNMKSNHNNRQSSSSQHYNEFNKNSYVDNNMKSGSTNYFSSVPRTSGESYNENNKNMNEGMNSENMNINYNVYNIKNSQTSEMNNNAIINQYRDNYRMLRNENIKKSKRRLNIEYNKKFDSEQNNDEYNSNEIRKSSKNYFNKYIPNNFRNNSFGKKNNEQSNGDSSLNIKYLNKQKKYISKNSSNNTNIINFNHDTSNVNSKIDNLKLSPESSKYDDDYALSNDENNSRSKQAKIKYFTSKDNKNYNKYKNSKNINYNNMVNASNRDISSNKNKNYNGDNISIKRKKFESNSNRYINTINNKEKNYYQF